MSILRNINDTLSAVLKLIFIAVIVLVVCYFGLSIYANVIENRVATVPDYPNIDKAQYEVTLRTTGQILLTDEYDHEYSGLSELYTLHGFYQIEKGKWQWYDDDIILDKYYFGDIIVKRRSQ